MNRPSEELLHKTLENRATAAEAAHGDRRLVQGKLVAEAVVAGAAAFFFASPPS